MLFNFTIVIVVRNSALELEDPSFDFNKKLLILGCGGHSKVVTEIAELVGFRKILYLDKLNNKNTFLGRSVLHEEIKDYMDYFFVAIGDNSLREMIFNNFLLNNTSAIPISLIHPSSIISKRCSIGTGTVIMPLCVINSSSIIGNGVIINTRASIDHDNCMKSFVSIAPGVSIGGNVYVGERSAISIGATIKHGIKIGSDVVIGASSYVNKDIDSKWIAYGTPAKAVRKRKADEKYL